MNIKKPTVVLLSGKSESGKDYIANIMKQQLEDKNNKVLITHYADLLKYILKTFFNWNGEKDENGRALLQRVGTNVIREKNPNYWTDFINDILDFFPNEWDYILIPDTRFPNEIEEIKKNYNVNTVTVRIDRPNYKSKLTKEQQRHASETALDNYRFDYHLFNTGTDKIIKEVEDFICIITKSYYKRICFIDMDCTVFNTVKCITELYDEDFKYYSDYKKIPWQEVVTWEFSELSAAPDKYIDYYFNQKRFFDKVEMYPNAKEVIDKLNNKYNIVFVSHGYSPNLRLKQEWVKEHFPYAEFIGVNLKHCKDKSIVDMKNGIFIDDTPKNLESSNADIKICYGDYEWNKDCKTYIHANNWKVIEDLLL